MKIIYLAITVLLLVLLFVSGCQSCGRIYDFIMATEPEHNNGPDTYANLFYNGSDNIIQCVGIKLKDLHIIIRNDNIKKTSFVIKTDYTADCNRRYSLWVTSEDEQKEWQRWINKCTTRKPSFEPGIVYPPDYTQKNPEKPEKE
jgi:hypothetical protein